MDLVGLASDYCRGIFASVVMMFSFLCDLDRDRYIIVIEARLMSQESTAILLFVIM